MHAAVDAALFLSSLALYAATLIPSVLSADNGEFQLVAWKLGIAHPPGYPFYTIVGLLFSRLFASPAYALNLLSAILAAATLVIVSRAVRMVTGSTAAGLVAAILLGTSTTFWAQATTANIRMPAALFTAGCVYLLISFGQSVGGDSRRSPKRSEGDSHRQKYLTLFALIFSLGLGHHLSLIFSGIFFLIYLLLVDRRLIAQPRRWIKPMLAFALGLLVLLYLPLRGATGGALANGEATTYLTQPDKLLDHILARGFEGDFFYFVNTRPDLLGDRLALLPTLFDFQFNLGALALAIIGVWRCLRRDWRLLVLLAGGIAAHTFVTLTYRAPQTVEYMLPAYVLFAVLAGCGAGALSKPHEQQTPRLALAHRALIAFGVVIGFARGIDNLPSYAWLAQNEDTRQYAESLLRDAPPDAVILSNWHWANPMWYLQQVEGLRRDVEVKYVFPRGEALSTTWLKEIDAALASGREVVVDMFFQDAFAASPYLFEPISLEAYRVRQAPPTELPPDFTPIEADFEDAFKLIGYRLLDTSPRAGEPFTFFLAWRVQTQPDRDYSFFAHLLDASGRVAGQADRALATTRYHPGDVIVERFELTPAPDLPSGNLGVFTGVYSIEDGRIAPLGNPVQVARIAVKSARLIGGSPPASAIPLAHGIYFLGVTPTPPSSHTLSPGERLTLDLRFLATRPLTRDSIVSVQMIGEGYSWKITADSVPALGAIPTLKWIAGSQVTDRHTIDIPLDAPAGPATVSLSLYDNFTQQPLALLDAQLAQHGPSITLGTWNIAP